MLTRSRQDRTREHNWARDEEPGYRYGYESAARYIGRHWDEVEPDLRRRWESCDYRGELAWDEVKQSVRDAWQHVAEAEDRPR